MSEELREHVAVYTISGRIFDFDIPTPEAVELVETYIRGTGCMMIMFPDGSTWRMHVENIEALIVSEYKEKNAGSRPDAPPKKSRRGVK